MNDQPSNSSQRALSRIIMVIGWVVILGIGLTIYALVIKPRLSGKLMEQTSSQIRYDHQIRLAHDSFSGYAILRSPAVQNLLKKKSIKITFIDDKADYSQRLNKLKNGKVQMAVFTIDAYIKASSKTGTFPAAVVLVIDETKGADAIVAYQQGVPEISRLSTPSASIMLVPDSPSETLARVMINKFSLPSLPNNWLKPANEPESVYKMLKSTKPSEQKAFVLWEPYVSQALSLDNVHVLLDSSKLKGYIVDVLVAERRFLNQNPDQVQAIVEAYLRARYDYAQQPDGLVNLLVEDSKKYGQALKLDEAKSLVGGIEWRNTMENYAHFGVVSKTEADNSELLDDMIAKIVNVLDKTDAIQDDPLEGNFGQIYYDGILRSLYSDNFHPSISNSELEDIDLGGEATALPKVRAQKQLVALGQSDWQKLKPVATMKVRPIQFGRGNARIQRNSQRSLVALADDLKSFPHWYIKIIGHTRSEGNRKANQDLAQQRADATAKFLMQNGISNSRIQAAAVGQPPANATGGQAQSVTFMLLEKPY